MSNFFALATAFALPLSTTFTDIFFIAAVVAYFLTGDWREKISFIVRNPVAVFLMLFFTFFIFGIFYTTAPLPNALKILFKYDKLFFAALLMPLFREEKLQRYAINAFLCAIGIALFFSYLKYFGMTNYGEKYGHVEMFKGHIAFSFLMSFASYLVMLCIINLATLHAAFLTRQHRIDAKLRRVLYWLIGLTIFWGLIVYNIFFMGMGRSGYFVFAGLLALLFLQKMQWRGLFIGCLGIILVFGGAYNFSHVFKERIDLAIAEAKAYSNTDLTSVGLRITFVEDSLRLIKRHPFFGSGTGSFEYEYAKINPTPVIRVANPHNEYLHVAVQLGALGVVMLLFLFGMQLWYSRLLPERLKNITQATIVSIIIGSFANSWLLDTTPGHFYVYFIALTFASLPSSRFWVKNAAWVRGAEVKDDGALP